MYYPETANNETHMYVEREVHLGDASRAPSLSPGESGHDNSRSKWGSQPRAKRG